MARIRTIKPEFPQSETIGRLSRDARLLFIQLWTIVDDEGRFRAASRMLASLLYPYDDDARELIDGWLDELEHNNCIARYEIEGSRYLEIVNWLKHQKIDHASKSKIPSFREGSRVIANDSRSLAPDLGPRTMDLGSRTKEISNEISSAKKNAKISPAQILEECLSPETAKDVVEHRKALRKPLTVGAAKGLAKAFKSTGDAESAAREMILRGWQGFKPEWMAGNARDGPMGPVRRYAP